MNWTQIAAEGGLLPNPLVRDSFELWPAKRKEFVVDFTRYMDGTPTTTGDVIYLVNTMKMTTGRMWDSADQRYQVPVLKIVIGGLPAEKDESVDPLTLPQKPAADGRKYSLREPQPLVDNWKSLMASAPTFELQRGSVAFDPLHPESAETEWLPPRPPGGGRRGSGPPAASGRSQKSRSRGRRSATRSCGASRTAVA